MLELHWLENKGCLLEHATGSGKTLTGQMIASHMFDESDVVFITTPFIDIANQWEREALSNFKARHAGGFSAYILEQKRQLKKPETSANR